jgi:hypothetical protein
MPGRSFARSTVAIAWMLFRAASKVALLERCCVFIVHGFLLTLLHTVPPGLLGVCFPETRTR